MESPAVTAPAIRPEIAHLAVPIHDVRPHPRNPRRGDMDVLRESLREHGQYKPIYANKPTGFVVAGNHTWRGMQMEGAEQIALLWLDVDEATELELVLVDNSTSDRAGYDDAKLAAILQAHDERVGLVGTGYNADALDDLLARIDQVHETEPQEFTGGYAADPDEMPEPAPAPAPAERPRDLILMLDGAEYATFREAIAKLEAAYGTRGIADTVLEAVWNQVQDPERRDAHG